MTKDDLSSLIKSLQVKQGKALRPEKLILDTLLLKKKGLEKEDCILLKEPSNKDFQFTFLPDKLVDKMRIRNDWTSMIKPDGEYELLTITLPELPTEDIYKICKSIYFSVVESYPEQEILVSVFHPDEPNQKPHFHFLITKKSTH